MSVLYITQNGITDHIGRSQVAPYVLLLAQAGFKIHVLSAEKPGRDALIGSYRQRFGELGVKWTTVRYENHPRILGPLKTQARLKLSAKKILSKQDIRLVHCRSFPPAMLGDWAKRKYSIKYIFDFRDFYANGGMERSRGLSWLAYRYLKHRERRLVRNADKIVVLTNKARQLLIDWYLADRPSPKESFEVIPCCADFSLFDPSKIDASAVEALGRELDFNRCDTILLYLGSLGPDYLLREMLLLFQQLIELVPEAKMLFLANNGEPLVRSLCIELGIEQASVKFRTADRDQIPGYISLATLSVIFIKPALSKAGCSPTKLAELFAMNVPVIANKGVGDMETIVDREANGSVLVNGFEPHELREALMTVLEKKARCPIDVRTNSRWLSLESGCRTYAEIYSELLSPRV